MPAARTGLFLCADGLCPIEDPDMAEENGKILRLEGKPLIIAESGGPGELPTLFLSD